MKTGRVLIVLAFGLTGLVGLLGFGCSAAGEQPTRPRATGSGGAVGAAGADAYDPYGSGGAADDAGADASAGGGGAATGAGGYDPYGTAGAGGSSYGTGGVPSDAPICNVPNTAANKLSSATAWNGSSPNMSVSNGGYWYSYYDGSSGVAVLPTNTSFGAGIQAGFIVASGTGTFASWGGGIGASFFNGSPTPVADLSPYKGIGFQFINSAVSDAHFALDTWDFDPAYCCANRGTCYGSYGVDLPKGDGTTVISYWMCWPGITCAGPGDASADLPNPKQVTLTSSMSGTVPFDPKRALAVHITSKGKTPWDFQFGKMTLF